MSSRTPRSSASLLVTTLAALLVPAAALAQAPAAAPRISTSDAVRMYHPAPPLPSYEVATIKRADASATAPMAASRVNGPHVRRADSGETIKSYILDAYDASTRWQAQVLGGPAWISSDVYVIQGKAPDELQDAMQKMTPAERENQTRMMQQALLADRFHLKMHFETRQLPIFELTAAKGGIKIKQLATPAPADPESPPSFAAGRPPLPSRMFVSVPKPGGGRSISVHEISMSDFANFLRSSPEIGGKPIVDKTGFPGTFDVTYMDWSAGSTDVTDAPSIFTTISEDLGLKLTATKGPVEVLVIDSIDRPSEN